MVSSKAKNATIHDVYGFPLIADYRRTKQGQIRSVEDLTPEQTEWLFKEKEKIKPMDREWKEHIQGECWALNYSGTERLSEDQLLLRNTLISIAGEEACLQSNDPDTADICRHGQIWLGMPKRVKFMQGIPSQCHKNVCNIYEQNYRQHDVAIATGYALSTDGLWRCHSWLLRKTARTLKVIETTVPRVIYYGFVMSEAQALKFVENNIW